MLKNFPMIGTERPRGLKKRVPCSDLHFRKTISGVTVNRGSGGSAEKTSWDATGSLEASSPRNPEMGGDSRGINEVESKESGDYFWILQVT